MKPSELRAARRALGLTQAEMAVMLGYQGRRLTQTYNALEKGRRRVREPQRRLVCAMLDGWRPDDYPER